MGEVETPELRQIVDERVEEHAAVHQPRNIDYWARLLAYTVLVLVGQSSAIMLGGLYFNGGGGNIFLAAILESVGFPILIPISIYCSSRHLSNVSTRQPGLSNKMVMAAIYIFLGLLQGACSILYSVGLQQLPVSTYSLICATQLGFNALFAFFLNSEKLTPPTLNALILLTISSALLIFQPDHSKSRAGKGGVGNFMVGFSCTLAASTLYALTLSLTQLIFVKIIKKETLCSVLDMIVFMSLTATCALLVPLSAGGEWREVVREMETFHHGRAAYVVVVTMMAVASQLHLIGSIGLIFEVSSLFSNVIATVGLPIVPILGVIFFHESMDGIMVISIILAFWGFTSYVYQYYFRDREIASRQIRPCVPPADESSQVSIPLSCF
ncbi:hypothetical protein C2S51_019691 [Perilla frutescens var. frutescens]|nr:hypothetical protein C2S51_019691 [Perilla frutescens var. frutescens]